MAMSESATELAGPSLEDILWRAMDRFAEEPAVLDEGAGLVEAAGDARLAVLHHPAGRRIGQALGRDLHPGRPVRKFVG